MTRTFVCKSWSYSFKWVVMDILALFPGAWEWGYGHSCKAEIRPGVMVWGLECGLIIHKECMLTMIVLCMIHGWSHSVGEGKQKAPSGIWAIHIFRDIFYSQKNSGLHIVLVIMRIVFLSLPWATASKCRLHSLPGKSQLNFQAPIIAWDHYLSSKTLQRCGEGLATSLYQMITKKLTMIQKLQWGTRFQPL